MNTESASTTSLANIGNQETALAAYGTNEPTLRKTKRYLINGWLGSVRDRIELRPKRCNDFGCIEIYRIYAQALTEQYAVGDDVTSTMREL